MQECDLLRYTSPSPTIPSIEVNTEISMTVPHAENVEEPVPDECVKGKCENSTVSDIFHEKIRQEVLDAIDKKLDMSEIAKKIAQHVSQPSEEKKDEKITVQIKL